VVYVPVITNTIRARIEAFDLLWVMRDAGAVGDQSRLGSHSFEPVPYKRRYYDKIVIVRPEKYLLDAAVGGTVGAIVEQYKLNLSNRNSVVKHHFFMHVPGLDRTGMNHGKVDFAETLEVRGVLPEHMHDLAAVIEDLAQRDYLYSSDHESSNSAI
jgi:hypothetical protein